MTIEELLQELQSYWGKDWVEPAVRRFVILAMTPVPALTDNEVQEFRVLHKWILEMIEVGIASGQAQEKA